MEETAVYFPFEMKVGIFLTPRERVPWVYLQVGIDPY